MFTVNPVDGTIFQVSGEKLKSSGILAREVELPIPGGSPVRAICLDHRQYEFAVKAWEDAFPGSKGQISIVNHATVEAGMVKLTGGGPAYSDEWIVVAGKIAVNPLALRLLTAQKKSIREAFEHELQANGILADLV
jgi:hypothetical protein